MAQAAAAEHKAASAVGLRAYAQVTQTALTPTQASLLLHERLCQEFMAAKLAYRDRRLDRMCRHIEKCQRVLLSLANDVKLTPGARGPLILTGFYLHLFEQLPLVSQKPNAEKAFDDLISMLRAFCMKLRAAAAK